jgi:hypothetical protein
MDEKEEQREAHEMKRLLLAAIWAVSLTVMGALYE